MYKALSVPGVADSGNGEKIAESDLRVLKSEKGVSFDVPIWWRAVGLELYGEDVGPAGLEPATKGL